MAFGSIGGRATAMMRFVHCWVEDEHLKVMHDDVQWVGVGWSHWRTAEGVRYRYMGGTDSKGVPLPSAYPAILRVSFIVGSKSTK